MAKENIALILARREKRLKYWKACFNQHGISKERRVELNALLSTYGMLIARIAQGGSEPEVRDAEQRLLSIERRLTSLFEEARQATSDLSERGASSRGILEA